MPNTNTPVTIEIKLSRAERKTINPGAVVPSTPAWDKLLPVWRAAKVETGLDLGLIGASSTHYYFCSGSRVFRSDR